MDRLNSIILDPPGRRRGARWPLLTLVVVAFGGLVAANSLVGAKTTNVDAVRSVLKERFSRTEFDTVTCAGYGPLCEVVAGKTVFYVDPTVRHAFIGRLYDLDGRRDLTQDALQRIDARGVLPPVNGGALPSKAAASWSDLPFDAAIVRNPKGTLEVAVFSDLNCGYCRALSAALKDAPDIKVYEFLVGFAGSEDASRAIGCAQEPNRAIEAYFRTRQVPDTSCEKDIVNPARAAARRINVQGTPTFVRRDGAVMSGFRDMESLRRWIEEASHQETKRSKNS